MVGVARACDPFTLGFDVYEPLTDDMLDDAVRRRLGWVGRYLNNLTEGERDRIFARDLGILPYTQAMTRAVLTTSTGDSYGRAMAVQANTLGVAAGVHIGIDLELPRPGSDCAGHVNAMARALLAPGNRAALYVGAPQPLSSTQLFALVPDRYIKGGGRIVDAGGRLAEPECGWAALQLEPLEGLELAGNVVDVAIAKRDYEGRSLVMWWPK